MKHSCFWVTSALVLASTTVMSAQTITSPGPLEISTPADPSSRMPSMLTVTNRSQKPVLGYVIRLTFLDDKGAPTATVTETRLAGLKQRPSFIPGEKWSHKLRSTVSGKFPRIDVDYVLFQDGSSWGNNSAGYAQKLKGVQEGWNVLRAYLRRMLQERGPQPVADFLTQGQ